MSTPTRVERQLAGVITIPVVRAMLDEARGRQYGPGRRDASSVLGIYADPTSLDPSTLEHRGERVQVVPCVSALAVRQALLAHDGEGWLVVVTNRPEEDLGVGILAHLVSHKLRTPNAWDSARQQFAASGVEAALFTEHDSRALAVGLLMAHPEQGWPPAPAGALTRDHALSSVGRVWLGLPRQSLDALGVLRWAAGPGVAGRIADLRARAGDAITDATLRWICEQAGSAAAPLHHLMARGEVHDALPLGIVLGLLVPAADGPAAPADAESAATAHQARQLGLGRLAHRWQGTPPGPEALRALGEAATQVVKDLLGERTTHDDARRILQRTDTLLEEIDATQLAASSDVLPSGLSHRLLTLAETLRTATLGLDERAGELDVVADQVARHAPQIEAAWAAVQQHRLADPHRPGRPDDRLGPVEAAVRLTRWLAAPPEAPDADLATLALRQGRVHAWVDAAVNDAHDGVADPRLAAGLTTVLTLVRAVRDRHDRAFAEALARATRDDDGAPEGFLTSHGGDRVWLLEHLLRSVVVPLARETPTLLLVLDGMSTGVATEVVADVLSRREGWQEARLPGAAGRAIGLAALPSLTEVSRASLLCGRLTTGGQSQEQAGYAQLVSALGVTSPAIFHKRPLDSSQPGFAVADDVAQAIGDETQRLVTCVLNTIDDALDRSDPAGTAWTADAIKHLRPLLERALAAGRTVVLTADHGHVVERRQGTQRSVPDISSGRSRSAEPPAGEDEVLVTGPRVLKHEGRAVLPSSERLRYGPLKAGYHGGAAPAEVVVPVVVLVPGEDLPDGTGLTAATTSEPAWWSGPVAAPATVEVELPRRRRSVARAAVAGQESVLFDAPASARARPPAATREIPLGEAVIASDAYAQQKHLSGRLDLEDDQVRAAVQALATAPGTRLSGAQLATVLDVAPIRARGATAQLTKVLNVEGYPVVRTEGSTVILDVVLLREQFLG